MALIEIDGLPGFTVLENGDFPINIMLYPSHLPSGKHTKNYGKSPF